MTKDYFESEDLMQETFLSVYRHIDDIKEESLKSYLAMTAMNKSRDYLRKNSRYTRVGADEMNNVPSGEDTLRDVINEETGRRTESAIMSLKEPYREVAEAYYIKKIPLTVFAHRKGINPKTAQSRLGRARKKLRNILKEDYGDG